VPVKLVVPTNVGPIAVVDSNGLSVVSQLVPLTEEDRMLRGLTGMNASADLSWIVFLAKLPALGYTTYFVSANSASGTDVAVASVWDKHRDTDASAVLTNGMLTVTFDGVTGALQTITNTKSGITTAITQDWNFYASNHGDWTSLQPSGAYIFRPNDSNIYSLQPTGSYLGKFTVLTGPVVQELHYSVGPYISHTYRLYQNASTVEFEWTVGPIPIDDWWGKEVVTRFNTSLQSASQFLTDSGGREMYPRVRNQGYWGNANRADVDASETDSNDEVEVIPLSGDISGQPLDQTHLQVRAKMRQVPWPQSPPSFWAALDAWTEAEPDKSKARRGVAETMRRGHSGDFAEGVRGLGDITGGAGVPDEAAVRQRTHAYTHMLAGDSAIRHGTDSRSFHRIIYNCAGW
jgi:hypothetical protein